MTCPRDADDELEDHEYPDEPESDDDDADETIPCPHCGEPVYEDAERCPSCGRYRSREEIGAGRPPWWIVLGVLIGLAVVLGWVVR
jgi:hypothetical protein